MATLTLRKNTTSPLSNNQIDDNFTAIYDIADLARTAADAAMTRADSAYTLADSAMTRANSAYDLSSGIKTAFEDYVKNVPTTTTTTTATNTGLSLDFTPVRQGGGDGQSNTQVHIGTNNTNTDRRLYLQTGTTDGTKINHGDTWPINIDGSAKSVAWSGVVGITEQHNAMGTRWVSSSLPTSNDGKNGDIWYQV